MASAVDTEDQYHEQRCKVEAPAGHDGPGRNAFTDMNAPLVENADNQHHSQRDPRQTR